MKVRSVVADETGTVGNLCCHDESSKYKLIMSFYFDCFSIQASTHEFRWTTIEYHNLTVYINI